MALLIVLGMLVEFREGAGDGGKYAASWCLPNSRLSSPVEAGVREGYTFEVDVGLGVLDFDW